jgi:hypothetical protein
VLLGCSDKPATVPPVTKTQPAAPADPSGNKTEPQATSGGGGDPNARRENMGRMMQEMQQKMKEAHAEQPKSKDEQPAAPAK